MINEFFSPYIQALYGAAYNIQQSLEGYGLSLSNFIELDNSGMPVGSYWSPAQASLIPAVLLVTYSVFILLPLLLSAGYVMNRVKGSLLTLFILMLPGLLNVFGWLPSVSFVPEEFSVDGAGIMGEVIGYLPLLMIGLASGWCITVIIYDSLKLSDKFRNLYDHFWYGLAIVAGVFFIADSEVSKHRKDLVEESKYSRQASAYLARQLKDYYQFCVDEDKTSLTSCIWASDIQQTLTDYTYYNSALFVQLGPKSTLDVYFPYARGANSNDAMRIREEIKKYNEARCPVRKLSSTSRLLSKSSTVCERVPANLCRSFPEPPKGFVDEYIIGQTVAVASECIIPTLVRSRYIQEELFTKVKTDSRDRHLRGLYFLIISLVVGGKIANASTKLVSLDSRPDRERRRLIQLAKNMSNWILGGILASVKYLQFKFSSSRN